MNAFIDQNFPNETIDNFLSRFDAEEIFDDIIAILIMKGRYSLTEKYLNLSTKPYNPAFTKIALEYDCIDIVYLIKKTYPNNFARYENEYINSLNISFQK